MNVHFSSKTDLWSTPQDLFNQLNVYHKFTLDVCATKENAKCDNYFTKEIDGLKQVWSGSCWMNPPYGREIKKWMEKAYNESKKDGTSVVCLVPARTDTAWWHDYAHERDYNLFKGTVKVWWS